VNRLTIVRSFDAPADRVWEIVGNPGVSPGPGVDVEVEQPGEPDGTGLTRAVKVGPALVHEEIIGVGPGPVMRYRMTKGAPVRDYLGKRRPRGISERRHPDFLGRPVPARRAWDRLADLTPHETHTQPRAGRNRRQFTRVRRAYGRDVGKVLIQPTGAGVADAS